jgi:hypothetical protein
MVYIVNDVNAIKSITLDDNFKYTPILYIVGK